MCKCTLYITLFSISLTINIGIGTHFVYHWYINCSKKVVNSKDACSFQILIY